MVFKHESNEENKSSNTTLFVLNYYEIGEYLYYPHKNLTDKYGR